jgi:alpha-L-rhamnosidase
MNPTNWKLNIFLLATLSWHAVAIANAALLPVELRCEYRVNPVGVDATKPRLSWCEQSAARGASQTASRILVASSLALLKHDMGDLWDTGKVADNQAASIVYSGKALISRQQCFWKVCVWDTAGNSRWSEPANWTMGLLQPEDWKAQWIGFAEPPLEEPVATNQSDHRTLAARWLRKDFMPSRQISRATVYFSGLGLSELYLNGQKVGNEVLSPGLTDYGKRVFYITHDVTKWVRSGNNAVGVILGNGRFYAPLLRTTPFMTLDFGYPKLLLQLELDYSDGSRETIVSDASWKLTTAGPIKANNEYDGEEYDARREMPGWAQAGFDDSGWLSAQLVKAPGGQLSAQMIEPIRVTGTLKPIAVTEPKPGVFVFDMGQNMVGWCRLEVRGPAGKTISLRHAERLKPDGTLYLDNLRTARATDRYTTKGTGREVYEPRFTYHGFRYVEITGFPGKPTLASLEGHIVNDDLATAGDFTCSQPMINHIYHNVVWSTRGNYRSVPTDCPQRDERLGWNGDRAGESKGETYLFDIAALYEKWEQDMADAQDENGRIPDVCPPYWDFHRDSVTWPSAAVIIPRTLLDAYADTGIIARQYPSIVKWIDHMSGFITNGILGKDFYGDWNVPPENPKSIHSQDPARGTSGEILSTCYFYHCLKLTTFYAKLLNQTADAQRFDHLAEQLKSAFNQQLYNPQVGYYGNGYGNGSQTACVLPLAFDLVPLTERGRVFHRLVEKITTEAKGHVGTGLVGGQWLNRVLADNGRADLAYGFATNTTYPSWGYMVQRGATTMWELWNGDSANPAMNSGNQICLVGDWVIWLYENLAGIRSDPAQPGFKHILMQPQPVGDLQFVKAWHRSPFGRIESAWQRSDDNFDWRITIPPNSTATIYLPASSLNKISEGGNHVEKVNGVKFLRLEAGRAVLEVGSGTYHFISREFACGTH